MIPFLKKTFTPLIPLFKNTSSTIIIRGLFGIARIIVLLLVAKQFAPEEFGRLSLVLSITEIFKVMADFGLDTVTIRRYSMDRYRTEAILNNALTMKLIGSTLSYLSAVLFFWFVYGNVQGLQLVLLIALSIYSTLIINAFVSYFQATLSVARIITSNVISVIVYIMLTAIFMKLQYPLIAFAAVIPGSEMVNLILTAQVYKRIGSIKISFDKGMIGELLRESAPVGIAGLIVVLYLRMDNVMIGWFLDERNIGEYAVAYRITEPFFLIFTSLSLSLYAHLSYSGVKTSKAGISSSMKLFMSMLIIVSISISAFVFIFANTIVGYLPDKYHTSAEVLMILCWSIVFKAINPQLTAYINAKGRFGVLTVVAAGNLLVNILLNVMLIPKYGIQGAAGAVVATEFINMVFQASCISYFLRTAERNCPDVA